VSEVQGEGNLTVYSDVSEVHREMLLCTLMCVSEVQGEGNVTV